MDPRSRVARKCLLRIRHIRHRGWITPNYLNYCSDLPTWPYLNIWNPFLNQIPITGTIFRVQKQVGRTNERTDGRTHGRTDIHTSIFEGVYTISPCGQKTARGAKDFLVISKGKMWSRAKRGFFFGFNDKPREALPNFGFNYIPRFSETLLDLI